MFHKQKNQRIPKNVHRYWKPKKERYMELSKDKKETFLGKKTKRIIEDIQTTESSILNRPISETEAYIENEKKYLINYESSSNKYENAEDIIKEHANKNKTKIKKGQIEQGLSQFNRKLPLKSGKNDKLNIAEKNQFNFTQKGNSQNNEESERYDEDNSSKENQIDSNEEESNIKGKNKQKYLNKKKRHTLENPENDIITNEVKGNNNSDDEESFENKNTNNRHENANYLLVKKSDNPNVVSREEFNTLNAKFETLNNSFLNFKKKMLKLAGVQGEINYQNEKYIKNNLCVKIDNLNYKYEVLINSYRVLFIRKLSNIFLDEIYEQHGSHFKTFEFKYKKKKHKITACVCDINGVGFRNINLIVDFLKHIKIRASSIIHMEDKEIKFKKEILFDYLNRELEKDNIGRDNSLSLKDAISLVFRPKKEKIIPQKENTHYEKMKKIFQKEKEDNNHPEKTKFKKERKNENKYKADNYDENDEEEERIKKILSGDESLFETNLSSQLDLLLQKIELNRDIVNPLKKIDELKKITPEFFFDSWKNSFTNEKFKNHPTYKYYVNPDNITSAKNLGIYLEELLQGININLEKKDPSELEQKVENE